MGNQIVAEGWRAQMGWNRLHYFSLLAGRDRATSLCGSHSLPVSTGNALRLVEEVPERRTENDCKKCRQLLEKRKTNATP